MEIQKNNNKDAVEPIDSFIYNVVFDGKRIKDVVYLTGNIKAIFGLSKTDYQKKLISGDIFDLIHPEDKKVVLQQRQRIFEKNEPSEFRYRVLRTDNQEILVEEKVFPNKSKKEKPLLCGVIQDVSGRYETQQKLIRSEKKFRRIFEKNLAGVYTTHVNGTILECNQTFATILGYDFPEELIGKNVKDLYYQKKDRKNYIKRLREEKSLYNYKSLLIRKDGRLLTLDNNVTITEDNQGKLNIIEGTLIDVTALHETKEALQQQEKKYRLLFEEANNAILVVAEGEEENTIIDINEVGCSMFKTKAEEIIGFELKSLFAEKQESETKKNFIPKRLGKKNKNEVEWVFNRLNGERFYGEVWISQLDIGSDKFYQLIIRDISDRKKREKEIYESRQSFKNIVDNSPAAIFIFTDEELVYTNPVGNKLRKKYLEKGTKNIYDLFPKKKKKLIQDLLKKDKNDSGGYTEIILGDGKDQLRSFSVNKVEIVHNEEPSQLFLMRDITLQKEYHIQKHRAELAEIANENLQREIDDHKKTQNELEEKTSVLRSFQESSGNLFIITLDKKYRISSMNSNFKKRIKKLTGINVSEGDVFLDLFKKEKGAEKKFHGRFAKAFKGEPQKIISHFPTKQGNEFWVETFINPIRTEKSEIKEISCVSHDITEKVQIQTQIKKSEASMRATLVAIPDFIFRLNGKGVFTDSRIGEDLGPLKQFVTTSDFIGKHIREIFVNKSIAEEFVENLKKALKSEGLYTHHFSFFIGEPKNGQKKFFENRFSKISDDEVVVISRDITEAMEYESRLIESVREKEVLLKEVHHRVKNNLQVINSILNLQSSYVEDPETLEIINESQNRIRSMSYIHESLYQTKNFNSINFHDYITTLVQNLVHSYQLYGKETKLNLNVQEVDLALDQAIPCGLILNELVSNALKYAYPEASEEGEIAIRIEEKEKKLEIEVRDFGVGLPEKFDLEKTDSLGLSLVDTLVNQLEGELILERKLGTKFLIIFEKQEI